MKRLILFEIIILFLATTFESDSPPPGWFQQTLPVNDLVNDIFFIDTSKGWAVTTGGTSSSDTAYILNTTNGGNNWLIQKTGIEKLDAIQFLDNNNGYAVGKLFSSTNLSIYKTTNGGLNWQGLNNITGVGPTDLFFVNKDTGWICDDDGTFGAGLQKTTNGGINWQSQLGASFKPTKLFFLNKDTGWVGTNEPNGRLFRTTNGGVNWNLQFSSIAPIGAIFFLNSLNGWIRGGTSGTNGVAYTTNSGVNWLNGQGEIGGYDIKFITDSIGYAGGGSQPLRIIKSKDGGKNWGYQTAQVSADISVSILINDTMNAWAGRQLLVHTTDGGGTINYLGIQQISNEIPKIFNLHQNYPNPFNPTTNIVYELKVKKFVKLKVFDITGREITKLVDKEQNAGTYKVDWNASGYSSGVYFYSLTVDGQIIDTKKMLLIK